MNKFLILAGRSFLAFILSSLIISSFVAGCLWVVEAINNDPVNFAFAIRIGIVLGGVCFIASLFLGLSKIPAIPEKE